MCYGEIILDVEAAGLWECLPRRALSICNIHHTLHLFKSRHCVIFFCAGSVLRGLPVNALLGEQPEGEGRWTLWPSINVPDWTLQRVRTAALVLTDVLLQRAGSVLRGLPVNVLSGEQPEGEGRWTLWPSINVPDWTLQHVRTAALMLTGVLLQRAGSVLRGLPCNALLGEQPGGGDRWTLWP